MSAQGSAAANQDRDLIENDVSLVRRVKLREFLHVIESYRILRQQKFGMLNPKVLPKVGPVARQQKPN
jgi:hypothetical protein